MCKSGYFHLNDLSMKKVLSSDAIFKMNPEKELFSESYSNISTVTSLVIKRYLNRTTVLSFSVVKYALLADPLLGYPSIW